MTDKIHVFISYAVKDSDFVNQLREDLDQQDDISYWIDKKGLRPGTRNYEKEIRQALREAYAVVYVVTPHSYESDNVQGEIAIAGMEGCPIYPIWSDGDKWRDCVPIDIVKTQYIDMRGTNYTLNLEVLFSALRGNRPELAVPALVSIIFPPDVEPRNPYKGLNAFTEKDVADFFGRDKLISELLQAVKIRIDDRKDLLLTVIGASGSGKSSVVMAGLLPKLKVGALPGSDGWTYLKPMVPGDHPVQALNRILLETPELNVPIDMVESDLQHASGVGLFRLATKIPKKPVVLYIDQFEELFMTGVPEEERQQFINLLINAVTLPDSPVLVLLTMRADFYDRPMNYPELGRLIQAYNRSVLPMTIADLRDTVEKPAAAAGLSFEDGLIADIIFDLRDDKNAQAGTLPLLQYTLEQLCEYRVDRTLTVAVYQEIGGVKGAIGVHAEKVFLSLDEEAQNAFARVFQALVHVDEKGTPTRKRETQATLKSNESAARLVDALINRARVLRVDAEKEGGIPYVEVAHEALLTSWERLFNWIKSVNNDLRLVQEMKAAAARWVSEGYPKHRLWSHELLQPIYAVLERLPQILTPNESAFIQPEAQRLLEDFKNAPEHVQLTIIERDFARIGKVAVPTLVQAYGYSSNDSNEVYQEIMMLLWAYPIETVISLRESIKIEDEKIRLGVVKLISYFEMADFVPELLSVLKDKSANVRRAAAEVLVSLINFSHVEILSSGNENVVSDLLIALNDSDRDVRRAVAESLGQLGDGSAVPDLLFSLKEDIDKDVRRTAAEALVRVVDENAIPDLLVALKDGDGDVRRAAVEAFGQLENQSVVPDLLIALKEKSEDVRQAAAEALGKLGDQSAIPDLLVALKEKSEDVRQAAAEALGKLGDQSAIPDLLVASKDSDWHVQKAASRALNRLRLEDRRSIPDLLLALTDKDRETRLLAESALKKFGDTSAVPELLVAIKNNKSENVRRVAVIVLGELGDKRVVADLVVALKDRDREVRQAAAEVLGKIGDQTVVSDLLSTLEEKVEDVRRVAVIALGQLRAVSAIPNLVGMLKESKEKAMEVRQAAAEALGRIGDRMAVPDLLLALKEDEFEIVRQAAAEALGRIGDRIAVPDLLLAFKEASDRIVRQAAAEALGRIGDRIAVPDLLLALKKERSEVVRQAATEALGRIGDRIAVPDLLLALKKEMSEVVRQAAVEALGKIGDQSAVSELILILTDSDKMLRQSVAKALRQLEDVSSIPTLIVAMRDIDNSTRNSAAEALSNIKLPDAIPGLVELLDHPFGIISKPARQALELMDIPESRAALAEYDAKHKG